MSERLFQDDVLFFQRLLSCSGLYTRRLDGQYGKFTAAAEEAFHQRCLAIAQAEGTFDPRTETAIHGLQLAAQPLARRSLNAIRASGRNVRLISGTRSYGEQNALFRKGRFGNPGPRVTNAHGGQSWHNFGLAWDIGLFSDAGAYLAEVQPYVAAAAFGRIAGLEWGGDWHSFPNAPHYQLASGGERISAARARFEAGGR